MEIEGIFTDQFYWMAPVLVAVTTFLAGLINQGFKVKPSWAKQLIAWVIGIGLSVVVWAIEPALIVYSEPKWMSIVAMSIIVGLSSNGIYDIPTIKGWISGWFEKRPKA